MDTNNHYRYSPLSSPRSIRLIMLHSSTTNDAPLICELVGISLDSLPEYDTLSYTWNNESPIEPMTVISAVDCLGSQTLLLAPNCAAALRVLRKRIKSGAVAKVGLWVDAICINQSSNEEKSTQVGMMAEIYNHASQVVLWLGASSAPPDLKSLWMIQALRFLTIDGYEPEWLVPIMKWLHPIIGRAVATGRRQETLSNISRAPYWSRMWTLQECTHTTSVNRFLPAIFARLVPATAAKDLSEA